MAIDNIRVCSEIRRSNPNLFGYMKKDVLKSSFAVGSIALVFLIVGYQAALFVHHAAVARIAANRDCPDTVFVAVNGDDGENPAMSADTYGNRHEVRTHSGGSVPHGYGKSAKEGNKRSSGKVIERRSGAKDAVGKAVRENVRRKTVESFRFNPNEVSVEDLQRLGFSQKQAQSIENYRRKGGRFRRKSDFAKSFVVSDSIYRRLETYIDIPKLDLNLADSAAFDALPGIGGWFAKRMVEYRERLGGYSFPEQLMEIRNFDKEKFDGLSDLVYVSTETAVPYPIWTLQEEELKRHPYIGSAAHGVVLFRNSQPKGKWSIEELERNKVLTAENAERLKRCIVEAP